MILRILTAAALAATGHAGASVLVAVLAFAAWVLRTILPVLPQVMAVSVGVALAVMIPLTVRSVLALPLRRPAVTS